MSSPNPTPSSWKEHSSFWFTWNGPARWKSHCKIIVCKFCSLGVVISLFGRLQSGNYILRRLIVPAFSFYSPPQPCSVIMGATFKVESTFKLNRQTRMLTGLWKHPRLVIMLHKKVNVVILFAFQVVCVFLACLDGALKSDGWVAVLWSPGTGTSCGDGLWPTAVTYGLSAAPPAFCGMFWHRGIIPASGVGRRLLCWIWLPPDNVLLSHNPSHFFPPCL